VSVETDSNGLPSALQDFQEIAAIVEGKRLAVFLDYDGTLTPIVSQPEDALLAESTRQAVEALATRCTVAVISGRGLADLRALVGIEALIYAGSHGFEIAGPAGMHLEHEVGSGFLPLLDEVRNEVEPLLAAVPGARIERKKFSVAVHYRNVQPGAEAAVKSIVDGVLSRHPTLRVSPGKKVWDVQPDIEWNKGKALLWLLDVLGLNSPSALPLYIGDDLTDEDAFRVLRGRGLTIMVREEPGRTSAGWALNNTCDVRRFLELLASTV
jgi:trehalose 6-phosphate phosphatase